MKSLLYFFFLLFVNLSYSQSSTQQILSVAYEGGNITHPGLSFGYSLSIKQLQNWVFLTGAKIGFYYHHNYQTAIFLLPKFEIDHIGGTGFLYGVEVGFGPQRTFIPHVYEVDASGNIEKQKMGGVFHWVIAPGLRFGKDLSVTKNIPIQWFINPQLQFRNPAVGRNEKYLIMGIGINYKLK